MTKDISWLGENETGRNWDEVFALFYQKGRGEIFPNELKFWRDLCSGRENVMEIGAGSGFIAEALTDIGIKHLTLIEPEPANIRFLEKVGGKGAQGTRVTVAPVVFQKYSAPAGALQDVIYMSWDNLVMFRNLEIRSGLFRKVAAELKPGGRFAFHISSPGWNRKVYEKLRTPKVFDMDLDQYGKAGVLYKIDHVRDNIYNKHIVITLPSGEEHRYLLPTEAIGMEEVSGHARACGLELEKDHVDYSGTPATPESDDHVLVYKKR